GKHSHHHAPRKHVWSVSQIVAHRLDDLSRLFRFAGLKKRIGEKKLSLRSKVQIAASQTDVDRASERLLGAFRISLHQEAQTDGHSSADLNPLSGLDRVDDLKRMREQLIGFIDLSLKDVDSSERVYDRCVLSDARRVSKDLHRLFREAFGARPFAKPDQLHREIVLIDRIMNVVPDALEMSQALVPRSERLVGRPEVVVRDGHIHITAAE